MQRSAWKVLSWTLAMTSFACLVGAVAAWGVDVPFWDQWALIPHLAAWHDGQLAAGDLWRPHNEHRLLVPQLVMLGLAGMSDWDIRYELWTNVLLAAALWLVYLALVRRVSGDLPPWLVALSALSIFGLGQWQNWSWGWQIQIFLNVLAVTAGFLVLATELRWRLGLAALCGLVASFSFGTGLLFWLLALPLVWTPAPSRWRRLAFWLGSMATVFVLYLHRLPSSPEAPFTDAAGTWLKLYAGYVSVYLGGSVFAFDGRWALFGAPLLALGWGLLAISGCRRPHDLRRQVVRAGPLLLWAAYGVGAAMLTALGRLPMGIGQALSSRYITISQVFWLGLFALVAGAGVAAPRRRLALVLLTLIAAGGLVASALHGAGEMKRQHRERSEIRRAIVRGEVSDEALLALYPNAAEARRGLSRLRRIGRGVYRPDGEPEAP